MTGLPGSPATNASGAYTATVPSGWTGTATPTLAGYTFTPASRSYTNVVADQTAQDYTANDVSGTMILDHVPAAASSGILVDAVVGISNNQAPITAFGFEFVYDVTMFIYKGVAKGTLTSDWASIAGNNLGGGKIRIGGFPGSGTTIPASSQGSLIKVRLQVNCTSYGDETTATSRIEKYIDGIAFFLPNKKRRLSRINPAQTLGT